jgi:hypothetical protein
VLAAGQVLGNPWFGQLLATALNVLLPCAGCCKAGCLRHGRLLGAALAVLRLGLLSYWMNGYWAASIVALGGALVSG